MNTIKHSRIYEELLWRRLEKKLRLPVLIFAVGMTIWIANMIIALSVLQVRPIITL